MLVHQRVVFCLENIPSGHLLLSNIAHLVRVGLPSYNMVIFSICKRLLEGNSLDW